MFIYEPEDVCIKKVGQINLLDIKSLLLNSVECNLANIFKTLKFQLKSLMIQLFSTDCPLFWADFLAKRKICGIRGQKTNNLWTILRFVCSKLALQVHELAF